MYGRRLHEWFGPPPRPTPRELGVLIDRLPKASHVRAAQASDVELYMRLGLDKKPPGKAPPPPLVEFTPEVELLAAVYDRLGEVVRAVVATTGTKRNPRAKPWPRPRTARDEVNRRRAFDNFVHLESVIAFVPDEEWRAAHPQPDPAAAVPLTSTTTTLQRALPPGG